LPELSGILLDWGYPSSSKHSSESKNWQMFPKPANLKEI
jgi:hypothetical protein